MGAILRESVESEGWFKRSGYGALRSETMDLPSGTMHFIDENPEAKKAVVMVHGTPSWSYEYRHWIHGLRGRMRCLAPDHLGFGFSDRPSGWDYSLSGHSANLMRWCERVPGLERFSLVLHDFGGPIGVPLLLSEWDRIDKLVILNSWLWPFGDVDPTAARKLKWIKSPWMRWLYLSMNFSAQMMVKMSWGKHRKLTRDLHDGYRKMFPNKASRVGTWAFAEAVVDSDVYLRDLEAKLRQKMKQSPKPVFVIWGMSDGFVTAKNLERWEEILKPEKVLRLPWAGHFPQDEAFDVTVSDVAEFLK